MNKEYIRQWLVFKGGVILLMAFSLGYIYVVFFYMEMVNVKSLIIHGDVIEFSGKVLICMGGIPAIVWTFFCSLKMLFKKGIQPFKKYTAIGYIWMIISVASFLLGFIAAFVIPFILMASPYTSCNVGKYSSYYVINPDLCKTIVPDQWVKK
ncbi:DUF1240 domain-containing protein [Rahnella ecdela]|uniref:DUF1240 domain-containing protein n=1 Tax=Rahnella ecdela TaxID=2816250 RepID=A0ABS6LJE2_9GAMM|nr:DUF1240 domain-containing protein [Rahnella ecdela]MBU9847053.1 DUF1240 domain-containing protein [Rahnella ecdela]